jgi:putative ABC transport system ATP-binding protein
MSWRTTRRDRSEASGVADQGPGTAVTRLDVGPAGSGDAATDAGVAVRAVGLAKIYGTGAVAVTALDHVDVEFARGGFTAVMGPSGSGKSTLMHCLAGLDSASGGQAWVGDVEVTSLDDAGLTRLRREHVGFIFQQFNLLPTLTAGENITLALDIAHRSVDPAWFDEIVAAVGLSHRLSHRPSELSGGEQQRVACARALLGRPDVVFADEPTGNLDSRSGGEILGFLRRSVDEFGQTIVMVTHDASAAVRADRVIFLSDGHIVDDMIDPTVERVLDRIQHLDVGAGGR